jgi:hypothetical protein
MKLRLARSFWGADLSRGLAAAASDWRKIGYDTMESCLAFSADRAEFRRVRREGAWGWIADVYSDAFSVDGDVERHLRSLRTQVEEALAEEPILINAHSGLDRWSEAQMLDFFGGALALERELGVPIAHETHRRRCLATPWAAQQVLRHYPDLKLTADLSHWVCVTERLLEDYTELLAQVAKQTWHVHARVGFEHGPQVPDPRAPEWAGHLAAHEAWWSQIWAAQRARGMAVSTLTPEFGPPPYLWVWPHTLEPAADLGAICDWMAVRERGRFEEVVS